MCGGFAGFVYGFECGDGVVSVGDVFAAQRRVNAFFVTDFVIGCIGESVERSVGCVLTVSWGLPIFLPRNPCRI